MGMLDGKVAIVTGAASGIGLATVRLFLAEGARVVGIDRSAKAIEAVGDLGPSVSFECADAAEDATVAAIVARTIEHHGRLDIAHANAGIGGTIAMPEQVDIVALQEAFRVNAIGPMLLIKHAAPHLRRQKSGSIIVTASIAGQRGRSAGIDYSASKAAVLSIVQNSALSLGRDNVRVNALCPSGAETGMTERVFGMLTQGFGSNPIADMNPMGRIGTAEDMAKVALFLASDLSAYVNGQAINACGGLSASHPWAHQIPYS